MEAWWDSWISNFWLDSALSVGYLLESLPGLVLDEFEVTFQNDIGHLLQYWCLWGIVLPYATYIWLDVLLITLNSYKYWFNLEWPCGFETHFLRMLPVALLQTCYSMRLIPACWIVCISDPVFSLLWWVSESYIGFFRELTWFSPMMCSIVYHPM